MSSIEDHDSLRFSFAAHVILADAFLTTLTNPECCTNYWWFGGPPAAAMSPYCISRHFMSCRVFCVPAFISTPRFALFVGHHCWRRYVGRSARRCRRADSPPGHRCAVVGLLTFVRLLAVFFFSFSSCRQKACRKKTARECAFLETELARKVHLSIQDAHC